MSSLALQQLKAGGAVLAVPLVSQGEFIGLIALGLHLSERSYATDDLQVLNALAKQAAPTFQVASLVREQRHEAQQREQTEQELRVARSVQQALLPNEQLALEGRTVEALYQQARRGW